MLYLTHMCACSPKNCGAALIADCESLSSPCRALNHLCSPSLQYTVLNSLELYCTAKYCRALRSMPSLADLYRIWEGRVPPFSRGCIESERCTDARLQGTAVARADARMHPVQLVHTAARAAAPKVHLLPLWIFPSQATKKL